MGVGILARDPWIPKTNVNHFVRPFVMGIMSVFVHVYFSLYEDTTEDKEGGFCQMYRSAACSKFVGNKSIFVKDKYQQARMEERLTGTLTTQRFPSRNYALALYL